MKSFSLTKKGEALKQEDFQVLQLDIGEILNHLDDLEREHNSEELTDELCEIRLAFLKARIHTSRAYRRFIKDEIQRAQEGGN